MPKLSIITINYNNSSGLKKTMASVLSQSFTDYEYIVIDGGSTDGSKELILENENRLAHWVSEKDDGVFDAQNKGLKKAKGEFVQVLNSGDELASPTILEEIFSGKHYDADILYGNMYLVGRSGQKQKGYMPASLTINHMVKDTLWHPASFVRRKFFDTSGYYDLNYKLTSDYEWFLRAVVKYRASLFYLNRFIVNFYEDGLTSDPQNTSKILAERRKAQQSLIGKRITFIKLTNTVARYKNKALIRILRSLLLDTSKAYPHLYSPFGIPREKFSDTNGSVKLIIDPTPKYFFYQHWIDRYIYDRTIVLHGCETPDLNDIKRQMIKNGKLFTKVYSFDQDVVKAIPGSELFCFGSCWIVDEKNYVNKFDTDKKFKLSFIKSSKKELPGHQLRSLVEQELQKQYPFEILYPKERIASKELLFIDSMFHITIENSRHHNYFTEKLIDCFMSYTVPVYWGCPNIADHFDKNGIIEVESIEELKAVLNKLSPEDYRSRLDAVKKNYAIAKEKYAFFFNRIDKLIEQS